MASTMKKEKAPHIPLPVAKARARKLIQAEVSLELREAVEREAKARKIELRQIVEWGLKAWLLSMNQKEATRIGILPESE